MLVNVNNTGVHHFKSIQTLYSNPNLRVPNTLISDSMWSYMAHICPAVSSSHHYRSIDTSVTLLLLSSINNFIVTSVNDMPTPVAVADSSILCCSGFVGKFLSHAYIPSNMTSIALA